MTIFEPTGRVGYGLAYGTDNPLHRVNVPAERMNLFPDRPGDFLHWFLEETDRPARDPQARHRNGGTYPGRRDFGDYVAERLYADIAGRLDLNIVPERAMNIAPAGQGLDVIGEKGRQIHCRQAVLCNSHARPHFPWALDPVTASLRGLVTDPWAANLQDRICPADDVLIAGTGLTMADTALQLLAANHRGRIVAISRRGLLPQANSPYGEIPDFLGDLAVPAGPRDFMDLLRKRLDEAERAGIPWQMVIEGVRAALPMLWGRWAGPARVSALRHLGPYWNTRRFRLAPQVEEALTAAQRSGRLEVIAGQIRAIGHQDGRRFQADIRPRGSELVTKMGFDALINCIGPDGQLTRSRDPLMRTLREAGRISPDPLGLGLEVDARCRVIDARGRVQANLYAAGPLTRPRFPDVMAVRDIARQAAALAEHLLSPGTCPPTNRVVRPGG